ncbi:Hemolysin activation/secretion protein [Candidatus Terasakiella magnetica]|nr:Hemolysin activation/secretion protein [Candidatus Terasakiella magnetica]
MGNARGGRFTRLWRISAIVLMVAGIMAPLAVVAQVQTALVGQPLPGANEPGRVEKRFQLPPTPKSVIEPVVPEGEEQVPPDQADAIRFTLSEVKLTGATVFAKADLAPLWAEFMGKEISLTQVYKVAEAITAKYRNAGYILSRAIVPPQRIKTGIVEIKIVEGFVGEVLIEGDAKGRAKLFQRWGQRIKASRPLNVAVLERYSLLANDLPGAKVRVVLRPSKTVQGASDVVFIIEHKYFEGFASLDNRGTRTSGPFEYTLGASVNSALGLYEKVSLIWLNTTDPNELRYLSFQYDEVLTPEGLRLTVTANHSEGEPGGTLQPLAVRTRNNTFGVGWTKPLIRRRHKNLSVSTGLTWRDSISEQLGTLSSDDRIRSVRIGGSFDYSDAWQGVNLVAMDLHKGLDILGATEFDSRTKSRNHGRADFTKVTADLSRTQKLPQNFSLTAGITGQYATTALLASEEFGFGGSQFGRAYDSSEITGDSGIAAKLELQYTGQLEDMGMKYYQPFVFYDLGLTHDRDPINQAATRTGASMGLGARFGVTDYTNGSLEFDLPLTRPVASEQASGKGKNTRMFFSLTARY